MTRIEPPAQGEQWTIMHLVRWSTAYLEERGVPSARHDADRLLADALGVDRLRLYLEHDRPLDPSELAAFKERLLRRARREPIQYILGKTAFREIELRTDSRVLIPRPETEVLVEEALRWAEGQEGLTALDIGTGSGAIALSLLEEGPFRWVVATDASPEALEVARENAERTGWEESVDLRAGSLYDPLEDDERFDLIVSNPPYISEGERETLEPEVAEWEPSGALFGGETGREVLDALLDGAAAHLVPGGLLAVELGPGQAEGAVRRLETTGAYEEVEIRPDLTGRERIVLGRRRR